MFRINIIYVAFIITFLGGILELILLLIDTIILKFAIDISKEYVGVIKEYKDIPSKPIFLV